jgi:N-acetyl-anhydromuramyl-L-alanine amidase AmpD
MIERLSPNRSVRNAPIRAICLHANAGDLADGIADDLAWLQNPASQVSYHVLVAPDGTAYRVVPDQFAAWSSGYSIVGPFSKATTNFNRVSLNIAAHHPNDGRTPYPLAQVTAMAAVCRLWLTQYATIDAIVTHALVDSRKTDPRAFPWPAFWRALGAHL